MSIEDPTQRLHPADPDEQSRAAAETTTALPGPLDLAGPAPSEQAEAGDTGVLSLDDLFEDPTPTPSAAPPPAVAEAPTWTAMPVVSVRSEPVTPATPAPPRPERPSGPGLGERMRADAATAWTGSRRRAGDWLGRDDNALMLMTALVAIILIVVVSLLGA